MEICPKCRKSTPPESEICSHCGLVFWKWEARQKIPAPKPVVQRADDTDETTEAIKGADISYPSGWLIGVLPFVGIAVSLLYYSKRYYRLALQCLVLGLWPFLAMAVDTSSVLSGSAFVLFLLMPFALIYVFRKLDWPVNESTVISTSLLKGTVPGRNGRPANVPPIEWPPREAEELLELGVYFRRRALWVGLAVAVLGVCVYRLTYYPGELTGFFVIFGIPFFIGVIAVVAVPVMVIRTVLGKVRPNFAWMDKLLGYIGCFLTLLLFGYGSGVASNEAKENMQALIPALDRYRQENGAYPKTIEPLDSRYMPNAPRCYTNGGPRLHYFLHEDGSYSLICPLYMFMRLDYSSKTAEWSTYD
jgi:hypothetical protein